MTSITINPDRIKCDYKKHIETFEKVLQEINANWKGSKPEIITKESTIALIKTYKITILICTNIENIKQLDDKKIFPLLLSKYDQLINELYDLQKEMVELNALKEEDYRLFCEKTLKERNVLKMICDAGEDTEDNYEIVDRMVRPN
jgi:hypothetical protein